MVQIDISEISNFAYIFSILMIVFVYCGYSESLKNYDNLCNTTIAKIIKFDLQENKLELPTEIINKIPNYENKTLYKAKFTYNFTVNNKIHSGYFYNDGVAISPTDMKNAKKYVKIYKENPYIKIHYLKTSLNNNNPVSNISCDNIKSININFYNRWALIMLVITSILLSIILIFSRFCINQ